MFTIKRLFRRHTFCWMWAGMVVLGSVPSVMAQKVQAQVKLMLERLPLEKQQKLKDFADNIESYINDYNWTDESSDDEIPITIQIFLMDNSVSYESRYAGSLLITNNLDLQYYDKYWRFPYEAGEQLAHNENIFHPFAGFIDFYVNLILGWEYDNYGKFMGTLFYEKARLISTQARFNARFNLGWEERSRLIDRLLSEEYKPFRTMKDLFALGRSYVGEEDSTAQKYCGQALTILEDMLSKDSENEEVHRFLDAHHLEFIDVFRDDHEILERLIRIDPQHEGIYRESMKE